VKYQRLCTLVAASAFGRRLSGAAVRQITSRTKLRPRLVICLTVTPAAARSAAAPALKTASNSKHRVVSSCRRLVVLRPKAAASRRRRRDRRASLL
jgi:hypothetical protein